MKSFKTITNRANLILHRAWVNLGLPFDAPEINEKKEGIIDVEALMLCTMLLMEQDRIVTDLPAWIARFKDLINHQKLKSMLMSSAEKYRKAIGAKIKQDPFLTAPHSFKSIFGLHGHPRKAAFETVEFRKTKLNSVENVAQSSIMINSRLLYGTGFRADLITITHIKNLAMNGKRLSELLCTANSTISRLLSDLRACRFLNHENERVRSVNSFPGLFISVYTLRNLYEILDATEFQSAELKQAAYENLDFRFDKFGSQLVREGI